MLAAPVAPLHAQTRVEQPLLTPNAMMERTRKLTTYVWNTTYPAFHYVAMPIANELFLSLTSIVDVNEFLHFSFDAIKVRFTPVSNRFFRGALGLTYFPGQLPSTANFNPTRLSSLPTAIFDASSTAAQEVSLPWTTPLPKLRLNQITHELGHLVVWVLSPLAQDTAPGVNTTITLCMEANFVNPQLHDPVASSPLPAAASRVLRTPPPGGFAGLQMPRKRSQTSVASESEAKAEKGTISSTLDTISTIASAASVVPVVGTFASGLSVVASAASSVFDWFGLSKPTNITIPYYANTGPVPFSNCLHGVVTGDSFSAELLPYVANEPHYVNSYTDE